MNIDVLYDKAFHCSHGFLFLDEGKTPPGYKRILVYLAEDLEQRALIYLKNDEFVITKHSIRNDLAYNTLCSLLVQDFNIILEVLIDAEIQ